MKAVAVTSHRNIVTTLILGLLLGFGSVALTSCASGDKDKKGDELGGEDGAAPEDTAKKKKKKKKKKKDGDKNKDKEKDKAASDPA